MQVERSHTHIDAPKNVIWFLITIPNYFVYVTAVFLSASGEPLGGFVGMLPPPLRKFCKFSFSQVVVVVVVSLKRFLEMV